MSERTQRSFPVWLAALAIALALGDAALWHVRSVRESASAHIDWTPPALAGEAAQQQRKPILYFFTAGWCPPCQAMEKNTLRNDSVVSLINRRFIAVRVVDRRRENGAILPIAIQLQRQYAVTALPTFVLARPDGREIRRTMGYHDAAPLLGFLNL